MASWLLRKCADSSKLLEERVDTATTADRQWTWGTRYIDDLILRTRDTDANGTLDNSPQASKHPDPACR